MKLNKNFYAIILKDERPYYEIKLLNKPKIYEGRYKAHKHLNLLFNEKKQAKYFLAGLKRLAKEAQKV